MGRKRCEDCKRKELELAEKRVMDSWLCIFLADVFCPFSKVAKDKRRTSVCLDCEHYTKFMRDMEEEELLDDVDTSRERESFHVFVMVNCVIVTLWVSVFRLEKTRKLIFRLTFCLGFVHVLM